MVKNGSTISYFENVEKTINEVSDHLHTNHYIYILAKRHLIRMYGLDIATQETEKLELRERLCKEVRIFCFKLFFS